MVLFPISDDNPTRSRPIITIALIAACVVVFVWQIGLGDRELQHASYTYGAVPALVTGHLEGVYDRGREITTLPPWLTLVTCMFLHGGFMHILGNMMFLWIFGNNVEDAMGRIRFVVFYLLCGLAASLTHVVLDPTSDIPMIGASGAISGILGAYFLLHPHARVNALVTLFFIAVIQLPAWIFLGYWFVSQWFGVLGGGDDGVAWWAHLGGFVAGVALIPLFKDRDVPLLGRGYRGRYPTTFDGGGRWRRFR